MHRACAHNKEVGAIATQEPRLNEEITAREVRLIGYDGEQMGIYPIDSAQQIADDEGLDLVEIAPNSDPPVCRIMDYGKFKYDQAIKAKQAKKNQSKIETKEMKFRPKIDVGDYTTKKKHILRFLDAGSKVKITIMFRGREMAHPEQGLSILERLADDLKDVAVIEAQPKMEGRNMHMMIAPLAGAGKKKAPAKDTTPEVNEETPAAEDIAEVEEETTVAKAMKAAEAKAEAGEAEVDEAEANEAEAAAEETADAEEMEGEEDA